MIYSKKLQSFVPVNIQTKHHDLKDFGQFTVYTVKDNKIPVGRIDLQDTENGVKVMYIENKNPELYSGFGKIADQIEVEHCIKRGLRDFEITSDANFNSHALHYLRGKRFYSDIVNKKVEEIIKSTPPGEKYNTKSIGLVGMFMPKELIKKYIELIKTNPLLK